MSMLGGGDDLTIHARVDNDASPELRDIKGELQGVARQAETTGRTASRSSRGFGIMGKAAKVAAFGAKAAFAGALVAGYATVRLLKSSFAEAREAQKVGRTTAAIIKATGGAAKVSTGHVARYAGRLSAVVGMDDELIQKGANLLLTFKQIRNEQGKGNKVFDRATKAAVDLSAAGFGSVESGSKMLGKALNDPLKGITALSRAGVTFSAQQTETIGQLVEEGKLLKAQKIILGEVEAQVGGVAAAQATWGDKAKVVWGNLQERLGKALLPLLDRFSRWFVKEGGPKIDHFIGLFIHKGIPAIRDFAGKALDKFQAIREKVEPLARELLPEVWSAVKKVGHWAGIAADKATSLVQAFKDMPEWAKTLIVGGVAGGWLATKVPGSKSLGSKVVSSVTGGVQKVYVTNPGFGKGGPGGGVVTGGVLKTVAKMLPTIAIGVALDKWAGGPLTGGKPFGDEGWLPNRRTSSDQPLGLADVAYDATHFTEYVDGVATYVGKLPAAVDGTANLNREFRRMMTAAGFGNKEVRGLADNLTDVASQHPTPRIVVAGIPESRRDVDEFIRGPLKNVTTPRVAKVTADTSQALAAVDYLGRMMAGLSRTVSVDLSPRGFGAPREHGGRVLPGRSYVVGEKRPEVFRPDTPGRILPRVSATSGGTGGGVSIENLTVHAEGAASDVDVMDAVTTALDDYFRDREERG